MKFLVIIQARTGSTRFPRKILNDLNGKTALEQMLDRVSKSKKIDEIIVATTINKEDVEIVNLVTNLGYRTFVGSSEDVLDRYYQCAKLIKPEYVIRLTSDCPMFDWRVLDDAIDDLKIETDDLRMLSETFPDGQDLEIVKFSVLEKIWNKAKLKSEREHVTLYIKNHLDEFVVQDFRCELGNLNFERWTLDEKEDLVFANKIYEHFSPNTDFSMEDIHRFLNNNPDLRQINNKFIRNEGLLKSLKNDKEIY